MEEPQRGHEKMEVPNVRLRLERPGLLVVDIL
jgi:hypothetical protein